MRANAPDEDWEQSWKNWVREAPRKPWRGSPPTDWFRLYSADGFVPRQKLREVFGRRDGASWTLYARLSRPGGAWSSWRRITLPATRSARLTAAFEQPCLWTAPRYLVGEIPLKDGRSALNPDGPLTLFDLHAGDRAWGEVQVSWMLGEPGNLRAIVLAEAFGLPEYRDDLFSHAYEPLPAEGEPQP